MTFHSKLARIVATLLVGLVFSTVLHSNAADIVQLTKPGFQPYDGVEFGLHRLPASSPHPDLVAFSSHSAALVENDTNNLPDIFLWSRSTGQIRLLSVATNGAANGASFDPALSKDGHFVAFVTTASNLSPDTNKVDDVYIANLATGEIELVSVSQKIGARISATRNTVISEDGRYVAFTAARADLHPDTTTTRDHVLVRDRQTGETLWANSTLETSVVSARPIALRESRLWFFSSTNVYQFDLTTSALRKFGVSSVEPAFTTDGSKIATQVVSTRTNIVSWYDVATGDTNTVFTGSTNRVVRYDKISITDNGAVAFMAAALDDTNRTSDIYVALPGGDPATPVWVSSIPTPADATVIAGSPLISPDAKRVYFKFTTVSKLDSTRRVELYVRDLAAASPELIATGSYFSKFIDTPTGPLVIGGSGDFTFTAPSNETDLALLPYPVAPPTNVPLQIGFASNGWKISFEKIPNATPKIQVTDGLNPASWTDLSIPFDDGGTEWTVTDPSSTNQRFYRLFISP